MAVGRPVTPCVGVWIETKIRQIPQPIKESHPAWVCGLKQDDLSDMVELSLVTPCVGVWIETANVYVFDAIQDVTPCVGVWIETIFRGDWFDIKRSHPAWVCGLKLCCGVLHAGCGLSHPAWVCGLKHYNGWGEKVYPESHPAWVCGLKQLCQPGRPACPGHTLRGCVD